VIPNSAATRASAGTSGGSFGAEWTLGREALRAILHLSLDPASGTERPARRRRYIAQLLADVDLDPAACERLAGALPLLFGIDPIVSLRHNGDVAPERVPEVLGWAAQALVRAALEA
jgi:hypothetical protein